MEILKCENVRKVYGARNNQVVALDHINLSVQKGEFVAIVGASGSGKSDRKSTRLNSSHSDRSRMPSSA